MVGCSTVLFDGGVSVVLLLQVFDEDDWDTDGTEVVDVDDGAGTVVSGGTVVVGFGTVVVGCGTVVVGCGTTLAGFSDHNW